MLQIGRIVLEVLGFGRLALTGAEALLTTWFLGFMKGGEFDNIMRQPWPSTGNSVGDFVGGLISSIVVAIVIPFVLLATMAVPAIALSALMVAGILGSGWFAGFVRLVRVVLDFAGLFYLYIRSLLAHVHLRLAFWICASCLLCNALHRGDCSSNRAPFASVIGLFCLL